MPITLRQFVRNLVDSGLLSAADVSAFQDSLPPARRPDDAQSLARELVLARRLTKYQATAVYQGKTKGLVLGEYVVLDRIGAGGMGQVFKARHRVMERIVALKVLPASAMSSAEAVRRFQREVRAAAKLMHPNIVTAYDASEHQGIHYLVMEYVDGQDMGSIVREHGPLSVERAVDWTLQAARGLEYAHRQGIVHRDIKPANLLVDREETVRILDMGLARINQEVGLSDTVGSERLTSSGQVMGTCDYMAPEQAEDSRAADHRADIYSLGCTLYRLLTGRPPYKRETLIQVLLAHREAEVPSLLDARPDVPRQLNDLFQKMMAKRPEDRHQSMGEVVGDLESCVGGKESAGEASAGGSSSDIALKSFLDNLSQAEPGAIKAEDPFSDRGRTTHPVRGATKKLLAALPLRRKARPVAEDTLRSQVEQETDRNLWKRIAPVWKSLSPAGHRKRWVLVGVACGGALLVALLFGFVAVLRRPDGSEAGKVRPEQPPVRRPADSAPPETETSPPRPVGEASAVVEEEASDRRAAEWVLALGGSLQVSVGGQRRYVASADALPQETFQVSLIMLGLNKRVDAAGLENLRGLTGLRVLTLYSTPVTDAALESIRGLTGLERLQLDSTAVTDRGIECLAGLTRLEVLHVNATGVTDAGLVHLKGLTGLRELWLQNTAVSDAGLAELSRLTRLETLWLQNTKVTDAGLAHLKSLTGLQHLSLTNTKVTASGVADLRAALPDCVITANPGLPGATGADRQSGPASKAVAGGPEVAAAAAAASEALDPRYAEALAPVETLVAAWDFHEAEAALAKIEFADASLAARLAARRGEVRRLAELKERMIEKINTARPPLQKLSLRIRGVNGDLIRADQKGVTAKTSTGKTESHPWRSFRGPTVERLVPLVVDKKKAQDWLAAALLALALQDAEAAETYFEQAHALGLDIDPYLARLAAARLAEVGALMEDKQFTQAEAALTSIEKKYGGLPWFADNKEALEAARAEAEAGIVEEEAEKLYAEAAQQFKAKELFDLKPLVQKLKADYPQSLPVTDTKRKPSFEQMQQAVADLGQFLTVRRDGKGSFQTIQAAIDAAVPNSLIEIQDNGPYNEKIDIPKEKKGLTLRGGKNCWPIVTSVGQTTNFPRLVTITAPETTFERLVLAHGAPAGENPSCVNVAVTPARIHSCVLYSSPQAGSRVFNGSGLELEHCVVVGSGDLRGSPALSDCVWLGLGPTYQADGLHFTNVLIGSGLGGVGSDSELRGCTFAGPLKVIGGGGLITDCIMPCVECVKVDTRIEHCNVYAKPPFIDQAKPGKGCFGGDPQFVNPQAFDYRLRPTSPCRNRASDGGDVGVRYTPEMLQMLMLAFELRKRGVIKF